MTRLHNASLLGVAVGLLLSVQPVCAREVVVDPAGGGSVESIPATDAADTLLAEINQGDADLVAMVGDMKDVDGEALSLIRGRFDALVAKQKKSIGALVGIVSRRAATGADVTLLTARTAQLLRRSSRLLRSYIQAFQGDLRDRADYRAAIADDEIEDFERRMAIDTDRLDRLYLTLVWLSDQMVAVGLAVDDTRDFLEVELAERASSLLALLELTSIRMDEDRKILARTTEDMRRQARLFAAEERFDANKAALQTTIHLMKTLGMDYSEFEVGILDLTGEITPEALDVAVVQGLAVRWLLRGRTYLAENGPRILLKVVVVVLILSAFWILARLGRRGVDKAMSRSRFSTSALLRRMVVEMTGRVVMVVGLLIVLSQLGVSVGPLLAGLGVAGVVIGFALQDSLSNFAAGVMILAYQPYDVGDFVEAGGVTGRVRDMNLVSTRILTVDNQTMIVPNSKIWGDVIRNVTAQTRRRVDLVFGISYEDDVALAERVLAEIVAEHRQVLEDPEPVIKLHTLNDSSVDFVVRPWVRTDDYWEVYWDITRAVKMRFDEEGISIPYPQRDVHLIQGGQGTSG